MSAGGGGMVGSIAHVLGSSVSVSVRRGVDFVGGRSILALDEWIIVDAKSERR